MRRADGVYRWLRAQSAPLKDADGRVLRWYNLITDIEAGKRAQEALLATELNFRSIVATIPGMLYTLTPEGELEFTNDRITEFFGKSLDEMKEFFGKTVEEIKDWEGIMHQDDKQRALDTWMHALMKLRFLEHWEYHEIAAAQAIPIGTVQWRVFNAKKKLAPHLAARPDVGRNADMKQVALRNLLEASVFGDQCWVR